MEATNLALSPRESLKPRSEHKAMQLTSKPNQVSSVLLYGVPIVALVIEGVERLCLAQISNTLLKQFSYNEIHNRRVALGITCVQCTPVQLEILRRAGAMPVSSRRCGMITRREAERLCKSFLGDNAPPRLPDDFAFAVHHECAWGCRGAFLPARYNSSRAKCIKCAYCGLFFSPNKFIFHSHRVGPGDKYVQPDAANFNSWRRHMKLSGTPPEEVVHAWEDVKAMFNGGTRKRMLSAARRVPLRRPEPEPVEAKRQAASPPTAHAPVPRLADYVWGARLPLPYAIPWLKPSLWTPGALSALSGVSAIEEPRAFRPVRGRLESPQLSPVMTVSRSPTRSPIATPPRQSRTPTRSPLRSPIRLSPRSPLRSSLRSSPARSTKSDRDSDESVDIETTEEDQPKEVACSWPCRDAVPRREESCWSALVPKVELEDQREPWRLPDLQPPLHYMHPRERDGCAACVAPLPLLPPPAPAPH
ncbi:SKI family transcriptional corepressor 2-like [Hyposmocoma kahamanoa]|uniref:SKI family transcriptional corepressor 2-like n=1 Tax=Hyposmocoma kahamanoa TaxID=1477025 RepID=UPI000E6D6F43|nr:SKI family transcriptional corepressor 2-like [Hyposmocoma kahamanoa]